MLEIYCFDIGAVLILATMLLTIFFRKMTKGRVNRVFIQLVCVTLGAGIYDIISNAVNGQNNVPELIKYIVTGFYYFCIVLGFFLYARYVIDLSDTRHIYNKRWFRRVAKLPVLLAFACTIITYFTHFCYFYSSKGFYIRGKYNLIFYAICGGYALYATVKAFANIRYFGVAKTISIVSVAVLSLITSYIQLVYPYVVIDVLGFSVSLLFIMLFISNPDEKSDSVSGLKNYMAYMSDMRRAFDIGKPTTVIFINVLNFPELEKVISFDNFLMLAGKVGHKIEGIAESFKAESDMYYLRNGRFRVVVLDTYIDEHIIADMADRYLKEMSCDINVNETDVYIESNICVAKSLKDFSTFDELYNFGGLLENESKKDYVMYAEKLLESAEYDMITKLDVIMERGIINNNFEVFYQPIYSLKEKRFTHAEALLRLNDSEYGFIPPDIIIKAAELNGTIHKIGRIVLENVCRFIASDEFKQLDMTAVAVNISIMQLMQKSFADEFISMMQNYQVRSDQLIVEITESEASEGQKSVVDNIEIIEKNGTKFSLNNYGTGYSNITTTSRLPLASSKLDRTLINSEKNDKLEVLIENSIKLLKSLGRTVVVVGVENEATLQKYIDLDVDYIQGFYYSKPVAEREFIDFVKNHNGK